MDRLSVSIFRDGIFVGGGYVDPISYSVECDARLDDDVYDAIDDVIGDVIMEGKATFEINNIDYSVQMDEV